MNAHKVKRIFVSCFLLLCLIGIGVIKYIQNHSEPVYTSEGRRLKEAIQTRSLATIKVEALSSRYSSTPNVRDETGTPLLFYADDIQIAEYLVENYGAAVSLLNTKGETLLHYNVNQIIQSSPTRIPVLKYYLRLGLDPDQPDSTSGVTPRQLMKAKNCKGRKFPWDKETILLLTDPENELLADHDHDYKHLFENPRISIKPVDNYSFHTGYKPGYEFYAEDKSVAEDKLILTYRGNIANPNLSITLYSDYDFDTCRIENGNWVCKNTSTGQNDTFTSPDVVLTTKTANVRLDPSVAYPSTASNKNLQPDGRIILACKANIPDNLIVHSEYDLNYDFESIKLHYGRWVGN